MSAVRRRPVAAFVLVAIALELVLIPVFLLSGAQASLDRALDASSLAFNTDLVTAARLVVEQPEALPGVLLALAQVASPDIAVLIVAAILGGGALRAVARRFRAWSPEVGPRRGLRTWVAVIAVFVAMNVASGLLHAAGPDALDFSWELDPNGLTLIGALLVAMFLDAGALFEENGWRGFALPRLLERMTPVRASVVVGLAWAAWHAPVKFDLFLDFGPVAGIALFAVLTAKFVVLSVIITHFWTRAGGATLLAVAMHGLSNDSVRFGGLVEGEAWAAQMRAEVDLLVPMAVVAGVLIWRTRGELGRGVWQHRSVVRDSAAGAILRPLRRAGAARRLAYALLGVVLAAATAAVLVPAVVLGVLLAPVGVGLVILGGVLAGARAAVGPERRLARALLGTALPVGGLAPVPAGDGIRERTRALVTAVASWRAVGWLAARTALGLALGVVLAAGALTLAALLLIPFADGWLEWGDARTSSGLASAWTLLLVPVVALVLLHLLDAAAAASAALATRLLGADPDEELERLRLEAIGLRDRARLADELHDRLGHGLAVISLQAAAARRTLDAGDEAGTARALGAVQATSTAAGEQLDALLGELADERRPERRVPDLTDLDALASALRAGGLPLDLTVRGPVERVPAPVGGEVYRIVQEACTNVLRHAGTAATVVTVAVEGDSVSLEVSNAAPVGIDGMPPQRARSGGSGLRGLTSRVQRLGGRVDRGADGATGHVLSVWLPLSAP